MTYFLVAYLCITGPIAAWAFFSQDRRWMRAIVVVLYVVISIVIAQWFPRYDEKPAVVQTAVPNLQSTLTQLANRGQGRTVACEGFLDEVTAGPRTIQVGSRESIMVAPGKRLVLRGWIGSELTQTEIPSVKIQLIRGGKTELKMPAVQQDRPDVVLYKANPSLSRCGYSAELILPNDLPLGTYRVIVECRKGETCEQMMPPCKIQVVSPADVAALDAPIERELALRAQQESQSSIKSAPNSEKKSTAPSNKRKVH